MRRIGRFLRRTMLIIPALFIILGLVLIPMRIWLLSLPLFKTELLETGRQLLIMTVLPGVVMLSGIFWGLFLVCIDPKWIKRHWQNSK